MFKYIVAFALVAISAASANRYYVNLGETSVTVGNNHGLQVRYYVNNEVEKYSVINIEFFAPQGVVKTIQVPDVQGECEVLYQIFAQYAGQTLDYAGYKNLVDAIARYVQASDIDNVVLYAIQYIDTALFTQLFQGDFYQYIQTILNQEGYGSFHQGSYGYKPYEYGFSGLNTIQDYKPYSSGYGLWDSFRSNIQGYGKQYGHGYYGSSVRGYDKPYGHGYYGISTQRYDKPYGYSHLDSLEQEYNKPYGYEYYGQSQQGYSGPYTRGHYGSYERTGQGYGYGLGQKYLQGLTY